MKSLTMRMENIEKNIILNLCFKFSLMIIDFCEKLESEKKYVISRQLLKAGTSIGANIMEAQNAESKPDFIHKMKIAAKEAGETQFWLLLCEHSEHYPTSKHLLIKVEELNKLLGKIISSSKRRTPGSYFLSLVSY